MNRIDSKKIALIISNEQLKNMLDVAKNEIKDWYKISNCNKSMTKGVAWNILAKDFDVNYNYHILAKTNMIREFGEFLSDDIKIKKTFNKNESKIIHQEPIFNNNPDLN